MRDVTVYRYLVWQRVRQMRSHHSRSLETLCTTYVRVRVVWIAYRTEFWGSKSTAAQGANLRFGKDKVTSQQGEQGARTNKVRLTEALDVAPTAERRNSGRGGFAVVFAVELDVACALSSESPRWHHPCSNEKKHRISL